MESKGLEPKVSIIMATFNRAHLIMDALSSIREQTYSNWECLVIDDGGTDGTLQVLKPILETDNRFKYFKRNGGHAKGLPGCRNYGLDIASGCYIVFFDDDDIVHPRNLEVNVEVLNSENKAFCRYDKRPFFNENPVISINDIQKDYTVKGICKNELEEIITGEIPFASCTVMWDKKCFEFERFNEQLQYAEEWELYSRIVSAGYEGVSINKILYYNRKHPESNTGEFYNNDKLRLDSKVNASRLIIKNLKLKGLLTENLNKYFIRLSFFLKEYELLNFVLNQSNSGFLIRAKYILGYKFYPILRPVFIFKDKLLKLKNKLIHNL